MSWLTRLVSRQAHRVRDEAVELVMDWLRNPPAEIPDVDYMVAQAIRWVSNRLGVKLSDSDARWVKSQIDGEAMVRATRALGERARKLREDIERWEREGKL